MQLLTQSTNDDYQLSLHLLYGYIHHSLYDSKSLFYIPIDIVQTILLFYDNANNENKCKQNGIFEWEIDALSLLSCSSISSRPFLIGKYLFHLTMHPYVSDFVDFYIHLSSPNALKLSADSITTSLRLYCNESKSCWSSIRVFNTKEHTRHGWQKGALCVSEVSCNMSGIRNIKFCCFIAILNTKQITNGNTNGGDDDTNKTYNYNYPLRTLLCKQKKFNLQWNLNSNYLQKYIAKAQAMKRFEQQFEFAFSHPKDIETSHITTWPIQNSFWVLGCVPNGYSQSDLNVFKIYLKLIALPPLISRITCKFSILCVETSKHLKYIYHSFDLEKHKYWQTDKLVRRSYVVFNDFEHLTFRVNLEILQKYDHKNTECSSVFWEKQIEKQTRTQKLIRTYLKCNTISAYILDLIHAYFNNKNENGECNTTDPKNTNTNTNEISDFFEFEINLNSKVRFDSEIFESDSFEWFLQIYPNGYRPSDDGYCSVYLILAYLPSYLSQITVHFTILCEQTSSQFSTIHTFTHSRDGRGTRRMLYSKNFINFVKSNRVTLKCEISILKIQTKNENEIVHQFPLYIDDSDSFQLKSQFEWIIHKFDDFQISQRFESQIYQKMWNLSLFPNLHKSKSNTSGGTGGDDEKGGQDADADADDDGDGDGDGGGDDDDVKRNGKTNGDGDDMCKKANGKIDSFVLGLRLCALPNNVSSIKVEYQMEFEKFEHKNIVFKHQAYFDYDNYYVKWPKHLISLDDLKSVKNEIVFKVKINILELYDLKSKPIFMKKLRQ